MGSQGKMTYREARYVQARINGACEYDALRGAGFTHHLAAHPARIVTDEMREEVARLQAELVKHTLDVGLIDAQEIHEYLSDALRANVRDILNDDMTYKPLSQWPEIWQRMYEGGDLDIETKSVRSHDGEDKDGKGGWDNTGTVITKVKCRFPRKAELLKLTMMHKGVNAMVEQKQGDVNIMVVTAETARKVIGAKKRLAKVIDVTPEPAE